MGCTPSAPPEATDATTDAATDAPSGTAGPAPEEDATEDAGTGAPTAPPSTPDADGGPDGDPDADAGTSGAITECADDDVEAMRTAVVGQLDAIVAREWAIALEYATPSFRANIGPADFERIILDGFPVVAAAAGAGLGGCLVDAERREATLEVVVADVDGAERELLYLFERDADGWGIGGALPADGPTSGQDDSVTV